MNKAGNKFEVRSSEEWDLVGQDSLGGHMPLCAIPAQSSCAGEWRGRHATGEIAQVALRPWSYPAWAPGRCEASGFDYVAAIGSQKEAR